MSTLKADIVMGLALATVVLTLLPESPFQAFINSMESVDGLVNLAFVNWFIPFGQMIAIGQAWLLCITVYYAYEYIMRFIKLIS